MSANLVLSATYRLQRHLARRAISSSIQATTPLFHTSFQARPASTSSNIPIADSLATTEPSSNFSSVVSPAVEDLRAFTSARNPSANAPRVIEDREEALSLLRSQPLHYIVASLVGKTLVLHSRDLFSIPRLNDVHVGDVLELDRIHEVGSRDYTLRAQDSMSTRSSGAVALMRRSVPTSNVPESVVLPIENQQYQVSQSWAARLRPGGLAHVGSVLSKDIVRVRCTVVEHTKAPMELIIKKKRRKGYRRTIRHKQTYTRLRVEAIQIGSGHSMSASR